MIDLTPLEVRKKKNDFPRSLRGYDPGPVGDFLDLVADRLEQLVRENLSLSERVEHLDAEVRDYREREQALTEALVTAQEMRDDIRRQALREADLSRRDAEQVANAIRAEAHQTREREEEVLRRLRARRAQLIQTYRSFLERELAELAVVAESLELSPVRDEWGNVAGAERGTLERLAEDGESTDAFEAILSEAKARLQLDDVDAPEELVEPVEPENEAEASEPPPAADEDRGLDAAADTEPWRLQQDSGEP